MDTLHLTLRMTATEAIKMSVTITTCNSLSQDYTTLDNHIIFRPQIFQLKVISHHC